jgi:DNA-binding transcriptional LysR family regulator
MSLFEEMSVFVGAVEAGSFSGAAQRLGIAKSIVSRRINALESRLGTNLFHRTTRYFSLTETGLAYFERAQRILSDVAEADDIARQLQGELKGKLRVAAPMSFGSRHLSPAIVEFLTEHPQLDIDLDLNDRRVELVSEGYDLAIRIGKLPDSSLIARKLGPCRHVVCASPGYLAAHGAPVTPSDLGAQNHTCLAYNNRPSSEQWRLRVGDNWKEVPVTARRLGVNNGEVLCAAAIGGLGLVVLPTFIVSDAVSSGALTIVLASYEFFDASIYAIWPTNRQLSTKVRALVDFLAKRFGENPYWDKPLIEFDHGTRHLGREVRPAVDEGE